jgi:ubiquinone/menaquinone biosynthesis C-methylase UbiE
MEKRKNEKTSWQRVSTWYGKLVDEKGHYYHQHVVVPGVLKLLALREGDSLVDIACGQGVLGRSIAENVEYVGVDISEDLIHQAKKLDHKPNHRYQVGDVTQPIQMKQSFSHAAIILALQNIENSYQVIQNIRILLHDTGICVMVLNHPCFRIPRQSSWGIDPDNKLEYRRINRYMSPLAIPITMHPGKDNSPVTW